MDPFVSPFASLGAGDFSRLLTPGGAEIVGDDVQHNVSQAPGAGLWSYLAQLEAVCTVASSAAGTWTLRRETSGAPILLLQQPVTVSVVGTRLVWTFPVPWRSGIANTTFTVQASAATIGTWVFTANGLVAPN